MFQINSAFANKLPQDKAETSSPPPFTSPTNPTQTSRQNQIRIKNAQRRDTSRDTAAQPQPSQIRNITRSAFVANDSTIGTDTREPYRTTIDRSGADPSRPTVSDSFNQIYNERGIRNVSTETQSTPTNSRASMFYLSAKQQRQLARTLDRGVLQSKDTSAERVAAIETKKQSSFAAKRLVKAINIGLGTPLFMFWISIQVPLAIVGILLLALSAAAQAAIESSWILRTVAAFVGSVTSLFGVEVNQGMLHAPGLGVLMILFLFGLAIFIGLVFVYLLLGMKLGIRPIFGRGFLLKMGALLCVAFYIVPLINLLPLHVPYMMVMRRYPK